MQTSLQEANRNNSKADYMIIEIALPKTVHLALHLITVSARYARSSLFIFPFFSQIADRERESMRNKETVTTFFKIFFAL